MKSIKIFLASSEELAQQRKDFEYFIYQQCKAWDVLINVIAWENSISNSMSKTRLQDKYDDVIPTCDMFVGLFFTKVGKYTEEEFEVAWKSFQKSGKPLIFTYFKHQPQNRFRTFWNKLWPSSLDQFWNKLWKLGHFPTQYQNTEDLHLQFGAELQRYFQQYPIQAAEPMADENRKSSGPNFRMIPNPDYLIGRDDLLQQIQARLQQEQAIVLMNGLGGIGKTLVADAYANRFRQNYHHVAKVFVSGDLRQSLVDSLSQQLRIQFAAGSSLEQQFDEMIVRLQQMTTVNSSNLLLLDNANDEQDLIQYKTQLKATGWKILLTSRCHPDDYVSLAVDELSPDDATQLFLHHYPVQQDLSPLLAKIHYHTLLIELVAKAGNVNGLSVDELLQRLDSGLNHHDLQLKITVGSHADSPNRDKQTELYQYILALFEPNQLDDDKKLILRYFSVLPATDIPRRHLETLFGRHDNPFRNDLNELFKLGWLSKNGTRFKMHALVQEVVFNKLEANLETCQDLIETLNQIMESKNGFPLDLNTASEFHDYAKSVADQLNDDSDTEIGWLNIYLADFYRNIGQLENALKSIEVARQHFDNCQDIESLAISYERLGNIHRALGELDKARSFFELDMALTKQLHESNPKSEDLKNNLAISYSRLGDIHQAFGELDKARSFFELCMELMKQLYESNPKSEDFKNGLAISYSRLGDIHRALGELDKARSFFELDMALTKQLHESNPKSEGLKNHLAISYQNLGDIHQAFGELDKARSFFELEVELFEQLHESNPKSEGLKNGLAISYQNLGDIHQAFGELDKARSFFELFMKLMKQLHESNPKNVELKNGLAVSYYKLAGICEHKQQAKAMYQQAIALWKELYDLTGLKIYQEYIKECPVFNED
jgi:tetratricopeptide (TPR) repeat protein